MLFTFPSRYLFTIGHWGVLRLGGWSPHVQTRFHVSRLTRVLIRHFTHTRLSLFIACFPKHFWFYLTSNWPDPLSLATTNGVSVDILSSGYLDVSVRQVCFLYLCIQYKMPLKRRVSPLGNPRIKAYSQLPRAYSSVSRPSSPLDAKASTKCTFIAWIIICTEINLFSW